jgi:hypothetical protein
VSITTRSFYPEDPTKAGHAVMGTQVTIHAVDDNRCLIGDSIVKWDEAAGKNTYEKVFAHYEHHVYTHEQAVEVFEGKIAKLLDDGYVYEPVLDIEHFIWKGEQVITVVKHPKSKR